MSKVGIQRDGRGRDKGERAGGRRRGEKSVGGVAAAQSAELHLCHPSESTWSLTFPRDVKPRD